VVSVAVPTRPAEKLASRREPCPLCPHAIEKGDPIRPTTAALGWAHTECAEDYFDVYPEHAPRVAGEDEAA
jgi:hypothetical protein